MSWFCQPVILVFCSRDSEHVEGARALAQAIRGRFVDRLSNDVADLRLVAKYRVVEPVCVIAVSKGKLTARIPRLLSLSELQALRL